MLQELAQSSLVVYCGHNGGEQYITSASVAAARARAVVWLMGCSSGALRPVAPGACFPPVGMVMSYVQAGAPAVVGNLWEVTDRDLDAVCQGTSSLQLHIYTL